MVILRQFYKNKKHAFVELNSSDATITIEGQLNSNKSFTQWFYDVFLPKGYPDTVSPDYLNYQIWDSVQAFCSSICGTLSTRAVLMGLGVGDPFASTLGATFNWILKNGVGMIGGIIFAVYTGTCLDYNLKQWRLFADILNDASLFIEMLAPIFSKYNLFALIAALYHICLNRCIRVTCEFLPLISSSLFEVTCKHNESTSLNWDQPITFSHEQSSSHAINWTLVFLLCLASVMRACVGVAGSGTRAALIQHQSRANNSADIAAKDGSQETLVNLIALIFTISFLFPALKAANKINSSLELSITWCTFFILIACHVWSNYKALKCIRMTRVNLRRYNGLLTKYLDQNLLKSHEQFKSKNDASVDNIIQQASIDPINQNEKLTVFDRAYYTYPKLNLVTPALERCVYLGADLSVYAEESFVKKIETYEGDGYRIAIQHKVKNSWNGLTPYHLYVFLSTETTAKIELQALFHCEIIQLLIALQRRKSEYFDRPKTDIINASKAMVKQLFPLFYEICNGKLGWDFSVTLFEKGDWRYAEIKAD